MALKTPASSVESPPVPVVPTVLLELALYTNYTRSGTVYEKGTAYKFTQEDALALLGEEDFGRPIWRRYQPPKVKRKAQMPIVDSTEVRAVRSRQSLEEAAYQGANPPSAKRITVGTDEEIADVLNRSDDLSGDVTV